MDTLHLQNRLIGALIGLARATEGNTHMLSDSTAAVTVASLRTADSTDPEVLLDLLRQIDEEKRKLVPSCYICQAPCGRNNDYDMEKLKKLDADIRALKLQILSGIRSIAASAQQPDSNLLYLALFAIGMDDWGLEELLPIAAQVDNLL